MKVRDDSGIRLHAISTVVSEVIERLSIGGISHASGIVTLAMTNQLATRLNPLPLVLEGLTLARRVIEELVDDLDGGDASETVAFTYRGTNYEVDLSEKNAAKLDKALAPYIDAARKVKVSSPSRRSAKSTSDAVDPRAVRQWAKGAGISISDRGRVSADIVRQYQEAQG